MSGLAEVPECPLCQMPCGLQVRGNMAAFICVYHGAVGWVRRSRLNGAFDKAKWGSSE